MKPKRAFTLIELLVVIAIIAILAAILFPVFAQAKRAAKATASLSNTKQEALGILMYSNDYDDMWVVDMSFNIPNASYAFGAPFNGFYMWSNLIIPYIKTSQIFIDPIAGGSNGGTGTGISQWEAYNPEYGINWCLLDGGYINDPSTLGYGTTSATAISRPGDMVLLAADTLHTDPNWGGFYGIGDNGGATIGTVLGNVEGPYCNYNLGCSDLSSYWGVDNGWAGQSPDTPGTFGYTEGGDTSGVALRDNGLAVTAFCDGHSKVMSPGALAVGTTWAPTSTKSQVQLINADTYRWWQY
jgi:prepilin-type N-terminal cleavage/methylation domain-containing protein